MAWAFVKSATLTFSGSSATLAFPSAVTAGNRIIAIAAMGPTNTVTSITDSGGNSYQTQATVHNVADATVGGASDIQTAQIVGGGGTAISVTWNFNAVVNGAVYLLEYSGLDTSTTPFRATGQSIVTTNQTVHSATLSTADVSGDLLIYYDNGSATQTSVTPSAGTLRINDEATNGVAIVDNSGSGAADSLGVTVGTADLYIGLIAAIKLASAAVAFPPALRLQRRKLRGPVRRADLASPPWAPPAATPNPAIAELTARRPRLLRQRPPAKRARLSSPPWPQAAANTNQPYLAFLWQARRRFTWLRRRLQALAPPAQSDVLPPIAQPDQRREERFGPSRRGEFALPPWTQASAPATPAFTDWARRRLSLRLPKPPRGRLIQAVWGQAAANTNQPLTAFITLARRRFLWQRRARVAEGWWPQQAATVNPAFTDWIKRRVLIRIWPLAARARKSEAPVPQTAAPVNPAFVAQSPLRRRVFAILVRRARLAEPARPSADLVAASPARRLRWPWTRRIRTASPVVGQEIAPAQSQRRRALWVRRPRPLAAAIAGQDGPPVQSQHRRLVASLRRRPLLGFIPARVVLPNPVITEFIRVPTRIRQWLRQRAGRLFSPGWGQAVGARLASSGVSYAALYSVGRSQSVVGSAGASWLTANTVVVAQTAPSAGVSAAAVNTVGISYVPIY